MTSMSIGVATAMPQKLGENCPPPPAPPGGGPAPAQLPLQSPVQAPRPGAMPGYSPLFGVPQGAAGSGPLGAPAPATASAAIGAPSVGIVGATLGAATITPAPAATSLGAPQLPAVQALGAPAAAAPAPAATTAAPPRLTSIAAGGNAQDAELVESALQLLKRSPSGAAIVDRLLASGARINVISDAEFTSMGQAKAHAFYDPKVDAVFLRRSDLATKLDMAAVELAHEGTHLLDDKGRLGDPYIAQASQGIAQLGGPNTAAGREAQAQAIFELTMIKEARAFTFAGQVARDLKVELPNTDPTSIAAAGANDGATYAKVWQALLATAYNPDRRNAPVKNF